MPKYAFGIAARDEQIARQDANNQRRQQNINDIFNGLGVLAQSFGAAHRYAQQQANQATTASMMAGMLEHPEGIPPPPDPTPGGPAIMSPYPKIDMNGPGRSLYGPGGQPPPPSQPTPWNDVIQRQMSQQAQPQNAFEKLGNMFNLTPQGRLDPRDAMALMQMQRNLATQGLDTQKAYLENAKLEEEIASAPGRRNEVETRSLLNQALAQKALRDPVATQRAPEITAKDLATAQSEVSMLEGYQRYQKTIGDSKSNAADKAAAQQALMLSTDPRSKMDPTALQQMIDAKRALLPKLGGTPQADAGTAMNLPPDEALLSDNGKDTEVLALIQQFKQAHPGMPFDKAAFAGWVKSGR